MMLRFSSSLVLWSALATASAAATATSVFVPYRVSFEALTDSDAPTAATASDDYFLKALTSSGMVSVTNLPLAAQQAAATMVATQHECLLHTPKKQEQVLADGTVRRTIATTQTISGNGGGDIDMQELNVTSLDSAACAEFKAASTIFRQATHVAVQAFARRVTRVLDIPDDQLPLLSTAQESNKEVVEAFTTFADVVVNGDYLEHFHSYEKVAKDNVQIATNLKTIDVHTDQGLFLAFTPGRLQTGELTNGLYIQTGHGHGHDELQHVMLDASLDQLVFMLGDGVNQVVNSKLDSAIKLRAVPHALQLQATGTATASGEPDKARVWYGLMVLPPPQALHPASLSGSGVGVTFGEIRQGLIASGNKNDHVSLACSGGITQRAARDVATTFRVLADADAVTAESCNNDTQLYCWHGCLNLTDYDDVSDETCTSSSRKLACANPHGLIWSGDEDEHGNYSPQCVELDAAIALSDSDTGTATDSDSGTKGADEHGDNHTDHSGHNDADAPTPAGSTGSSTNGSGNSAAATIMAVNHASVWVLGAVAAVIALVV